ncbi:MAG: ribosome biogenesis GTPase YlqF [Gammaproteobacteria bacterium]|nr:ribosome biogenesis GTPase YlqF [Gammaproteobacteria bacterium]
MPIQWFPGHMHKARKEIASVLPSTDIIVEVLDARIPYSSQNPMLKELRGDRPCLRVLTKSDLADPAKTDIWIAAMKNSNTDALAIQKDAADTATNVISTIKNLCPRTPGQLKPSVTLVVGIPNVGKSTLINTLVGRAAAKTGNEPAITKRQQLIRLSDNWQLRDTPGVLWPNLENVLGGYRLAATGAIRDTAMDSSDVAVHLLDYLKGEYQSELHVRYGECSSDDSVAWLEHIGTSRGCLGAGGLVDFDRAARILLNEFRSGELGRVSLETPDMQIEEEQNVLRLRSEKKAKKKLRRRSSSQGKQ